MKDFVKGIVGHKKQIRFFSSGIKNKKLAHAYLFEGPSGIGKKEIAKKISRYLLCKEDEYKRYFDAGTHSDFLLVEPIDGAIKTDEVVLIQNFFASAPSSSEYRIVIIDDCDKMNIHAQNKILKIIEEPPQYALFFLISSSRDKIIQTLNSRLIKVSFNALSQEEIKEFAIENSIGIDDNILKAANGSLGKFLSLVAMEEDGVYSYALSLVDAIKQKKYTDIFDKFSEIEKFKDNLNEVLDALEFLNKDVINDNGYSREVLALKHFKYLEAISESRYRLSRNVQKELVICNLFYKLQEVF